MLSKFHLNITIYNLKTTTCKYTELWHCLETVKIHKTQSYTYFYFRTVLLVKKIYKIMRTMATFEAYRKALGCH